MRNHIRHDLPNQYNNAIDSKNFDRLRWFREHRHEVFALNDRDLADISDERIRAMRAKTRRQWVRRLDKLKETYELENQQLEAGQQVLSRYFEVSTRNQTKQSTHIIIDDDTPTQVSLRTQIHQRKSLYTNKSKHSRQMTLTELNPSFKRHAKQITPRGKIHDIHIHNKGDNTFPSQGGANAPQIRGRVRSGSKELIYPDSPERGPPDVPGTVSHSTITP